MLIYFKCPKRVICERRICPKLLIQDLMVNLILIIIKHQVRKNNFCDLNFRKFCHPFNEKI